MTRRLGGRFLSRSFMQICVLVLTVLSTAQQAMSEASDPNTPYEDSYDVLTRDSLFGEWQGSITGNSVTHTDGQMAGQAHFLQRGYDGTNQFSIVLNDHRHRDGANRSTIQIGDIPCGPNDADLRAVHGLELQNVQAGVYSTAHFHNLLADTGRDDFQVHPVYGPTLERPAILQTRWNDDGFSMTLTGTFVSVVAPVHNHTFDYERQSEGRIEELYLDVTFTLKKSPETQAIFDLLMCEEPDIFHVVKTMPESGRDNVILDGADFFVEFSDAVSKGSLDASTVIMTTRDENNGFVFTELDLGLEDETGAENELSLRIAPREPLRSGTVYEITIISGDTGVRGRERQILERDTTFFVSTMVDPDDLRLGVYQVSRNAPLVDGKPAGARIHVEWEELEDIHPEWQVLNAPMLAEIVDDQDRTVFPEVQQKVKRPDQFTDEDRRLGKHTVNLFGWTPTGQNDPRDLRAEILPDDHYPEDVEIVPAFVEYSLDYATESVDRVTFDYYIAAHSEWRDNVGIQQSRQVVRAAQNDRAFANQILPVGKVEGRFQGTYHLEDTICTIPGVEWVVCNEGFISWDNPAMEAAHLNKWNALVRLFHEQVAARSDADILVSYHPPSLGEGGTTKTPFEQPESLRRSGDEPFWFGNPDPGILDSLHADQPGQNTVIMSTAIPDHAKRPGILVSPLVAHEFGHVFGLPHTPYAENAAHKHEICQSGYKTTAPGIDGMRIALDGSNGWQKSSEDGNAQSKAPLLNLMFPCIWEPHSDYWIDPNQYNWLIERMPSMLRHSRGRRAALPPLSGVRFAHLDAFPEGTTLRSDASPDLPDARWIMLSGLGGGSKPMLLPAISVPGQREPLSGEGSYDLRVEDAAGRVLARTSVGPRSITAGPWPFSVTVPISDDPARIVLVRDGEILAERRADPALAVPKVLSHASGSTFRANDTLEWESGLSDELSYTVRYTADGKDWMTLAVLLGKPRFTPDPATLIPGAEPAFEIIAHDGVGERVTHLPVEVDVPLVPLAFWTDDEEGAFATMAFNVPINVDTLDAIRVEAGGEPKPANVSLDPSGMVLTIAPQTPEGGVAYTFIASSMLRAQDGRQLNQEVSLTATARPTTLAPEPPRDRAPKTPSDSAAIRAALSDAADSVVDPDEPGPEIVGLGEITLQLADEMTIPARILRCEVDEGGNPVRLIMDFETTPGDRVKMILSYEEDGTLAVEMSPGNGNVIKTRSTAEDGWLYQINKLQVTARGHVGDAGGRIEFLLTGQCPS